MVEFGWAWWGGRGALSYGKPRRGSGEAVLVSRDMFRLVTARQLNINK